MFLTTPKFIQDCFPSIVWKKKNAQKNILLTFDDGPSLEATPFILKILQEEQIKATFFLIGEQIEKHPALFKQIIRDGHIVANHSYSHKSGWTSNNYTYFDDIEKCQQLMPKNKLFRPPYGRISPVQIRYLKKKYKLILWDVFSWDFSFAKAERIKAHVLKKTISGSILVFHNNKKSLSNLELILKETIKELKQKKFLFSTTW